MEMAVQSGMLKTLGINLYTSIGKVLVPGEKFCAVIPAQAGIQ